VFCIGIRSTQQPSKNKPKIYPHISEALDQYIWVLNDFIPLRRADTVAK
jgi:hypothetical protein